ncbi:MAG: hypothetical protein HY593_04435 [Candidatus Omnitrophica bacterium]|nr:hypothetical protein [Candidatus Omnitrophota bacterium]
MRKAFIVLLFVGWIGETCVSGTETTPALSQAEGLTYRYPEKWEAVQRKSGAFDREILILGPKGIDGTYACTFLIRESVLGAGERGPRTLEEWIRAYKGRSLHEAILEEKETEAAGRPAKEMTLSYARPYAPLYKGLRFRKTRIRVRALFIEKDGRIYEFLYSAREKEYPRHEEEFERFLASVRFVDSSPSPAAP